jgi:hypothetical protein
MSLTRRAQERTPVARRTELRYARDGVEDAIKVVVTTRQASEISSAAAE